MDHFWKYACGCYTMCPSFNDIFAIIEIDNKANAATEVPVFIYYKVFIKAGKYDSHASLFASYNTNHTKCSVEVIGCNNNQCIINYPGSQIIN